MRLFRTFQASLLAAALLAHDAAIFEAAAQSAGGQQAPDSRADQRINELSDEVQQLKSLLDGIGIAQQQQLFVNKYTGDAGRALARMRATAPDGDGAVAIQKLASLTDSALPEGLKDKVVACVQGLHKVGTDALSLVPGRAAEQAGTQLGDLAEGAGCSNKAIDSITKQLRDREAALRQEFSSCQRALSAAGQNINADPQLYLDPANRSTLDSALTGVPQGAKPYADCAQRVVSQLGQVADANVAMQMAMSFAAQACIASGANPWVCVGAFAFALLMSALSGKGKGEGEGKGRGNGPGQLPGPIVTGLPGGSTDLPRPAPQAQSAPTNFVGSSKTGLVQCSRYGVTATCYRDKNPNLKATIDPSGDNPPGPSQLNEGKKDSRTWFSEIINSGADNGRLFFCEAAPAANRPFARIIIYNHDVTRHSQVTFVGSQPLWASDDEEGTCKEVDPEKRASQCSAPACEILGLQ